jgi:hypothetical protein
MLLLWVLPDLIGAVLLAVFSFGFGWGLLLVGCILLLAAGFAG